MRKFSPKGGAKIFPNRPLQTTRFTSCAHDRSAGSSARPRAFCARQQVPSANKVPQTGFTACKVERCVTLRLVNPPLGEKSQKHILLKYMSKRNDNFAELMDKFRQAGKLREKKLIISLLAQEYDKNLTQLNRSDFACLVGENRKLIDTKKYQKLLKSFIVDPYFVVRCEGYENLEYYKSFDWSNTLINAAKTEKHPYAQGYLFNAFRGHMNPRTLRFLTRQLDRQKKVRVLSSIYCALIEFARDYSLVIELLGLFDRARDYSEIYSIFSSMQDLSLPLPARIEFTNKLNEILAKMDKKLGLAKDLRTIIKTMKESRSWASSNRKLSYVQIANI